MIKAYYIIKPMKTKHLPLLATLQILLSPFAFPGPAMDALPSEAELTQPFTEKDITLFQNPTRLYRPETWFHFIGGNVSTQGITADLEALACAGFSGIQLFHGQFGGKWPQTGEPITCLSEKWDDAVKHTATEAHRLGLRFTMQNCPGWAMAGGPWVTASNAMRNLVWCRTDVDGNNPLSIALPRPQPSHEEWRDYHDIAVLAFPTPRDDTGQPLKPSRVRSNRENKPWLDVITGTPNARITLTPAMPGSPTWVEMTFDTPVTVRTLELPPVQQMNHAWCYDPGIHVALQILTKDAFQTIMETDLPASHWQDNKAISLAVSECTAQTVRLLFRNKHSMTLTALRLFSAARQNNWESEAAWTLRNLERACANPTQSKNTWVDASKILDVTASLDAQGRLNWTPSANVKWTLLRIGHVNAGQKNGPAPKEGTGWECDKLSASGPDQHFAGYIGRLTSKSGPLADGLLNGMLLDSWECNAQTWTYRMERAFMEQNGYPLRTWMPALFGYVVNNPETTSRFLRDWRGTINNLFVNQFFGRMAELAHQNKLTISYETAGGDVFPADIMEYYKHADIPMCEFWHPRGDSYVGSINFKPIKPCASAARLYGKPRVAAEAFTSFALTWNEHFSMLKEVGNINMIEGVTHPIFHTYTHNPQIGFLPPGTSFGAKIGTPFLRGQTWWKAMPEFTAYLARCNYMLERGKPVSDVLWYLGDEINHKPDQLAPFPEGFKYDYCNPDALLTRLSVKDGKIVTPDGIAYSVLWMPDCPRMLPETLEKIRDLVKAGATVIGKPPQGLATLVNAADAQRRFDAVVAELWTPGEASASVIRRVGKGRVVSRLSLEEALAHLSYTPDVMGGDALWLHRQAKGADWYFIAAPEGRSFTGVLRFRNTGHVEIWNPTTGKVTLTASRREKEWTWVALNLARAESCFVVFRKGERPQTSIERIDHDGKPVLNTRITEPVPSEAEKRIVSARYGDLETPGRWIDLTAKVRKAFASGATTLRINNDLAESDPAFNTRKRFSMTVLDLSGQPNEIRANEGEMITLPPLSEAKLPTCSIEAHHLIAWHPGSYKVHYTDGSVQQATLSIPGQLALEMPWTLHFPKGWGAPDTLQINELKAWKDLDLSKEGRAFSGTATYTTPFTVTTLKPNMRFMLDLGSVDMTARITVNGKVVGSLWAPPYRIDISDVVKEGKNSLYVEVTSTWYNRLVYDASLPEHERKTWTIAGPQKNSALAPSGLLGPVVIRIGEALPLKKAKSS